MSSVDDRIVNMQFNNKQFQAGAAESTKSLETLEKTIGTMGQSNGLTNMGNNVDGIRAKFSAMQIAGVTAIATIVNKAVNAGLQLAKSMTLDPLIQGFQEYEINLNSIQTIMANTGEKVQVVNKYLQDLNSYSDRTIYNFSQMAENIGRFTAAGVKLPQATSAIKGLANAAALSGSSVQQLNTAMYQMSQALSTGVIRLMDWNSLANAGMGGANIRNSLMATAHTIDGAGEALDAAMAKAGNFRDSLSEGWLTADIFSKTMRVLAGTVNKSGKAVAYTVEQLKGMGYSEEAAKELHRLGQAAIDSAQKVKTFTQLIDVVKESIGSGWAKLFQDLFGNFNQASKMWTKVSTIITDFVASVFGSVDKMLIGWRKLGGYQELWNGFANIFKTIGNLIHPFVAAFQSMLPAAKTAGSALHTITSAFESVTGWMEKMTRNADILTPILTAVFSVFKEIGSVASIVMDALSPLVDLIGQLVGKLSDLAHQGAEVSNNIVQGIIEGLDVSALRDTVENFATSIVDWIKNVLGIHSPAEALVPIGTAIVQGIIQGIEDAIRFIIGAIGKVASAVVNGFKDLFGNMDGIDWAVFFNTLLTGALILTVRNFIKVLKDFTVDLKGVLDSVTGPFDQLTSTLKTMQSELKARMLMDIGIAVALLSGSLIALSLIGPKKLGIGLAGLAGVLGLLVGSLLGLSKIDQKGLMSMSVAISLISLSVVMLAGAIALLGSLGLDTLGKGLSAVAIGLGILVGALFTLSKFTPAVELAASAAAMVAMAKAMLIMSAAVALLGQMGLDTLAKGLTGMGVGLGILVGALFLLSKFTPAVELAASAAALITLAKAVSIMAVSVALLGQLGLDSLAKGLAAMGIGLGLLVAALYAVSTIGPLAAVAAGAIIVMAQSMAIMGATIAVLGSLKWSTLAKGLIAIGLAFAVLFAAAAVATVGPITAGLFVLSTAMLAIGQGVALLGLGLLAGATAFSLFVAIGSAGIAILMSAFAGFLAMLPTFAVQLATAVVMFIETIASMAPRLREAFGEIIKGILGTIEDAIPEITSLGIALIGALVTVVRTNIPKFGKLLSLFIKEGLRVLRQAVPEFVTTGVAIIEGVLQGIAKHLPGIIKAGTDIVVALIRGIGEASTRIVRAAADTVLDFIESLAPAIREYSDRIRSAGLDIADALIDGLTGGLLDKGVGMVKNAVEELVSHIPGPIKKFLGIESPSKLAHYWGEMIVSGLVLGIKDNIKNAVGATIALANAVVASGDKMVARAQKEAKKRQIAAEKAAAKSKVADQIAKNAEQAANKAPKDKSLQKAAEEARKYADKQARLAQKAQNKADAAAQHVSDIKEFKSADAAGKGDILTARAQELSDRAIKKLAEANAEALAAKKLSGEARKKMLAQAKEDAAVAKKLAAQSKAASKKANDYYAKSVDDRIAALKAERKAQLEQEKFDNATDEEKAKILQSRADSAQKRAEAKQKQSEALVKQAKKLAKTDAKRAQRLLDRAERLAKQAEDAADEAKSSQTEADRYTGSSTGGISTTSLQLSRSAMEDAASAIDRYTKSLQQAEEAAQAATPIYQFVQNNTSPESLSDSEIYRQTKNLLSASEIKMGVK